jgi:5-methyltetrahydropteroyltriglutamate--homocysteine methyltransferase
MLEQAVEDTVRRQVELGITIVGDGEMSKPSYVSYVSQRLTGFGGSALGPGARDLADFPEFAKQQVEIGAVVPRGSEYIKCCVGPIEYRGFDAVHEDTRILARAVAAQAPQDGAFLTAASPGVVALFQVNKHFNSHEQYIEALVPELSKEYSRIVEAGFLLQLDCPDLAMGRHHAYAKLSEPEFLRIAEINVAAINAATAHLPADRLRMHLCWGNWHGPHHHDIPIERIFRLVMAARPGHLLFESANPRHAHEVDIFRQLKDLIPEDKVLVPGVIDSTTNFIEHPALVARRLVEFAGIVGRER